MRRAALRRRRAGIQLHQGAFKYSEMEGRLDLACVSIVVSGADICPRSSATDPRTARDLRSLCLPTGPLARLHLNLLHHASQAYRMSRTRHHTASRTSWRGRWGSRAIGSAIRYSTALDSQPRSSCVPRSRLALKPSSASSHSPWSHFALAVRDCGVLGGARQGCVRIRISYLRLAVATVVLGASQAHTTQRAWLSSYVLRLRRDLVSEVQVAPPTYPPSRTPYPPRSHHTFFEGFFPPASKLQ
ncbi:hypothetical protein C8F04DRAFT_191797 [Mycena alexandri]|uniref:Uncharacterized protein n=1 Tax=Mycena alexandri TaxID=1745969 RepID=A0AAD6S906_9AGAR|nr:hypothetical protein C8F04DRAFT_191797 [Mycena alexandri]